MTIPPIPYRWEGDVLRPLRPRVADEHLTVGEVYTLVPHEERSQASHNHYFAAINERWQSLPDDLMAEYPTAEHLRKKMLIRAGYADQQDIVLNSKADALKVAALARGLDGYAVVDLRGNVVRVYRAQTQSYRAMDRQTFQASKDAVLSAIDALLGVKEAA